MVGRMEAKLCFPVAQSPFSKVTEDRACEGNWMFAEILGCAYNFFIEFWNLDAAVKPLLSGGMRSQPECEGQC